MLLGLAIVAHLLAAVLWVGGMAFAHLCLRPAAWPLEPPLRLPLWHRTLARFLPVAFASVLVLVASGYALLFGGFGGFGHAPVYVHLMHLTGWVMFLLFLHLWFVPWRRFKRAMAAGDLPAAGASLSGIRRVVVANLGLGLLTAALGTGRYWSG